MSKELVRKIKTHYKQRWEIYRHNSKNPNNKQLFLEEQFVLKNILPGTVLAHNCFGEMYQGIIPVVTETQTAVPNVLLINPLEFRYATQDEIVNHVSTVLQFLERPGRLIINVNLLTLVYDRLNKSRDTYINELTNRIVSLGLKTHTSYIKLANITPGYGHLFLSFTYE